MAKRSHCSILSIQERIKARKFLNTSYSTNNNTMHFNKIAFIVFALLIATACASIPGHKIEHKGEPTKDMRRAIDMVVAHLGDVRGHKQSLTKIDRIQHQVVAGRNYFLDIRVRSDQLAEHAASAIVFHKLDDSMEVITVDMGVRMDSLNQDQHKGLFMAMQHLEQKHKQTVELIMIKKIESQVVAGVIYHFSLSFKGDSLPMREEKISVHKAWTGDWVVMENE
jgi:hypothetical protein